MRKAWIITLLLLGSLAAAGQSLSLSGTWFVQLDPDEQGIEQHSVNTFQGTPITLPGTLDEAGIGTPTVGNRYGILSRRHEYIGPAWYCRTIEVPKAWAEHPVELYLERVMWASEVWVDGVRKGRQDGLGTPHIHPLGRLTPGKHLLAIRIDNRMQYNIGDKGHCYGEYTQIIWNGVVGRIELRPAKPWGVLHLTPDAESRTVTIRHDSMPPHQRLTYRITDPRGGSAAFRVEPQNARRTLLRLKDSILRWDEFSPSLYTLEIASGHGKKELREEVTFGFRTVRSVGSKIVINNRPTLLRGNLDCVHFPLSGYPSCSQQEWERIFTIYKQHGLNHVRFHSWCPPEAAFAAADKLGIYIQAEVLWIDWWMAGVNPERPEMTTLGLPKGLGENPSAEAYVPAELLRMTQSYGNHPSFLMVCIGNELGNSDFGLMQRWTDSLRVLYPERLYAVSTARTVTPTDQYMVTHHYPGAGNTYGLRTAGTDFDWESTYAKTAVPTLAHELGQYPVYPLWSEIDKYTGVLEARNLAELRELARQNGLTALDTAFHQASGALQTLLYKANIEALLRTPSCAGYQLLSMTDYSGQGEALVGWLDSFWDSKGIVEADTFRQYGGAVVPLARFDRYVWESTDTLTLKVEVANYGSSALHSPIHWTLAAPDDTLGEGTLAPITLPQGGLTHCGTLTLPLHPVTRAAQYTLTLELPDTPYRNQWNLWIYPPLQPLRHSILITDTLDAQTLDTLRNGASVLLLAHRAGSRETTTPLAFTPLFWSNSFFPGQTTKTLGLLIDPAHPALQAFPTASHSDWQWEPLCDGRAFNLNHIPGLRPIVQPISDFHINDPLASLFECRVGQGKVMVCGHNIGNNPSPSAKQLLYSFLRYMSGPDFAPADTLPPDQLLGLLAAQPATPKRQPCTYTLLCDGTETETTPYSGEHIEVKITTPNGILGDLQVTFSDDAQGEMAVEGRTYPIQTGDNTLFVMREDTNDGSVTFRATAKPGTRLTLTRCELIPRQ